MICVFTLSGQRQKLYHREHREIQGSATFVWSGVPLWIFVSPVVEALRRETAPRR
jgi:ATP sulfurylase